MKLRAVESRLESYGVFDPGIVGAVSEAAQRQDSIPFKRLAEFYDIHDGPSRVVPIGAYKPIDVIHISPIGRGRRPGNYDSSRARVLFSPMGIGADASMAMRAMRLYCADPREQLLVVGNTSTPGRGAGSAGLRSIPEIWRGNLRPLVEPTLSYLGEMGVGKAVFMGYSYGADMAVSASRYAPDFGIEAGTTVAAESAGLQKRSLLRLGRSFLASGAKLDEYIKLADSPPLNEARSQVGGNLALYAAGLLRPTNLAAARTLSRGVMSDVLRAALDVQQETQATIAYGTLSELVDVPSARSMVRAVGNEYPGRVAGLEVPSMHHAGGDDINLHAAIMLQGIRMFKAY